MRITQKETDYVFKKVHGKDTLVGKKAPGYNMSINRLHTEPGYSRNIRKWVDTLKRENDKG